VQDQMVWSVGVGWVGSHFGGCQRRCLGVWSFQNEDGKGMES
jgi:hypothetical protein